MKRKPAYYERPDVVPCSRPNCRGTVFIDTGWQQDARGRWLCARCYRALSPAERGLVPWSELPPRLRQKVNVMQEALPLEGGR